MPAHGPAMPAELALLLREVVPPDGRFGHRQHVHLAFVTARAHGTAAAITKISSWIRHITAYEHRPHHVEADPAITDFGEFKDRYPALLDKRLLSRHYSSAVLASAAARGGWVGPDLAPFPWSEGLLMSPVR